MKHILEQKHSINPSSDLLTMVTIICHLMTLYAMRPCAVLAKNINRHMDVMLSSSVTDSLGEWLPTFQQLHMQWNAIAKRHHQQLLQKEMVKAKKTLTH